MKNLRFNQRRVKPGGMPLLAFAAVLFLIISCDNSNNSGENSGQLFRQIYNNTSWVDSYGIVYTFTSSRIFNISSNAGDCYFYSSGNYSNIDYDGCVYSGVDNVVITEDQNTLSARQQISSNGTGSSCGVGGYTGIIFEVLDENTMEVQLSYNGVLDETFIINKTTPSSTQGCADGTQNGLLW